MRPAHSLPFALLSLLFLICSRAFPQDGAIDSTFNTIDLHGGRGPDGPVESIVFQSDGKIIVGGAFLHYSDIPQGNLARTNPDGSLDTSFDVGIGTNGTINSTAVQPDGKILIAGEFTNYNGVVRNCIARLNTDGSLDTDLEPGAGANGAIRSLAVQADGKILIGGDFTTYGGAARNHIARINSDGSLDSDFNPGTGVDGTVLAVIVKTEGTIILGGAFTMYDGTARNNIAGVNSDGSLNTLFNTGTGANGTVRAIVAYWFQEVMIGGDFTTYDGVGRNHIARLSASGSVDAAFNPGTGLNAAALAIAVVTDQTIVVGGEFTLYNGASRNHILRLNNDGSLITNFDWDPAMGTDEKVTAIGPVQYGGDITIGGWFHTCDAAPRQHMARVDDQGNVAPMFLPETGVDNEIHVMTVQPDGKILAAGWFSYCDGVTRLGFARMNEDGAIDSTFNPGTGPNDDIHCIAVQADGKILIAGDFSMYNGTPRNGTARLNNDGSLDTGFDPDIGGGFYRIIVQPDGKILVVMLDGHSIKRINPDGSPDTSFQTAIIAGGYANCINLLPNGKFMVAGSFFSINGVVRHNVARMNSDGSMDTSFDPGLGPNGTVEAIAVQPDGKTIILGDFYEYDGDNSVMLYGLPVVRINVDGTLDAGYIPYAAGLIQNYYAIALQPDNKLLVLGFGGLKRLNTDGSLDSNLGTLGNMDYAVSWFSAIKVLPSNKILVAGSFRYYNNTRRNNIARLLGGNTVGIAETAPNGASALRLWPNPTEGDHVFLTVDGLDLGLRTMNARLFDATGREVLETTLTLTAGSVNTSLDLGHGDHKGVYLLQLIAGAKTFSQRVVIGP
jgi:uncharacterized delta-60 repeat protein